jgi:uridine kinase
VTSGTPLADDTGRLVVDHALGRAPRLGGTRLVCIDGPAGSGKTTLADAVRRAADGRASVELVHMDDVYQGWTGLTAGLVVVARDVVGPLRDGRAGRYRRWDWDRSTYAEEHVVEPADLLVVEGVGSGSADYGDAVTTLVWVEAPHDVRMDRGVARDGEALREHWLAWAEQEERVFAEHRTRERADLVVDGETGAVAAR